MGMWEVLGIAPTPDEGAIKRAYAARLKQTRPDVDPAGFRALRAAFEQARARAALIEAPDRAPVVVEAPSPVVEPVPVARASGPPPLPKGPPPLRPLVPPVRTLLRAGELVGAAQAWAAAVSTNAIGFREQAELSREIALAAAEDRSLGAGALDAMAGWMEWEAAAREIRVDPAVLEALARRAAERWYDDLRRTAAAVAGPMPWARRRRVRGARTLLLPAPSAMERRFPYLWTRPDLRFWLAGLPQHERFLEGRLDPARVAWCRTAVRRVDALVVVWLWRLLLVTRLF